MNGREIEEVLEALWVCSENKEHHIDQLKAHCDVPVDQALLSALEERGLIVFEGELVLLTPEGRGQAAQIIRRHRLAERLFVDILNMSLSQAEKDACEFEHMIAPQVEESICTLLGHPRECPHGAPIPEGKCCREVRETVGNMIVPLTKIETGQHVKVAYLRTSSHTRLHQLVSLGLTPGVQCKLHQKFPSYVVSCGHTDLALEEEVAADILVWKDEKK